MTDVVVAGTSDQLSRNNIALPWHRGGCAAIPIRPGGSKAPFFDWKNGAKNYQVDCPSNEEIHFWFEEKYRYAGVAVICGKVSGNLEMLELEGRAADADSLSRVQEQCRTRGIEDLWKWLLTEGYSEWTPSSGIHLLYRIQDHEVPGNQKLASRFARSDEITDEEIVIQARRPDFKPVRVLAETRGEGGYVVVAPTGGHCHKSGEPWVTLSGKQGLIPFITWEQRMALHLAITAALDESPPPPEPKPRKAVPAAGTQYEGLSPGDDFNARASWEDAWFTSQGWRVSHRSRDEIFWFRPGKGPGDGHSASTGYSGDGDRLYIWSTSTDLPAETPLSKFFVYSHYHFNGNMSLAARALREQHGYGAQASIATIRPFDDSSAAEAVTDDTTEVALPAHPGTDYTDTGYGRRLKDLYGNQFRYNTVEKQWYVWRGHAWEPDMTLEIQRAAEASAQQMLDDVTADLQMVLGTDLEKDVKRRYGQAKAGMNDGRLQAAVRRFACQSGIAITPEQFDRNADYLNLPNGTFDLLTGQLHSHDPDDLITLTFGAEYDPEAKCPKWIKFIEETLPNSEVRDYVQRALGYTLLGQPSERAMFLLHGPSSTGKSVMTSVMTQVFGGYGSTAPATTFRLKKNDTSIDVHRLRRKRFVATSEMPEGALLDEELVKRLTGGDAVTSRSLYEGYQEWHAQCVIWIATNFLPRVNGDDNAIWRRAKTIPMRTEFGTGERPEILGYAEVLVQERNGILNWLLHGLAEYHRRGLDQPDEITADIETYRVDVDSVASFLRDRLDDGLLVLMTGSHIRSSQLNTMYTEYCTANRVQPMGIRRFAKRLRSLDSSIEPVKIGGVSMWTGLEYRGDGSFG